MRQAFTLIELLLVLVILAVLAGVLVPRFTSRTEQARITRAKTDLNTISLGLDQFEIDTGRLPTSEEALAALVQAPASVKDWNGPYLRQGGVPTDPWGNAYLYQQPGTHNANGYDLYSYGPDGAEGGGDDIDNWSQQ
jgi:general secretion pathway protein G